MRRSILVVFVAAFVSASDQVWSQDTVTPELIKLSNEKLAKRLTPLGYPDINKEKEELIDKMPGLTGNESKKADFDKLRERLSEHGKKIAEFGGLIVSVCSSYDQQDAFIRKHILPAKLISYGFYEADIVENINEQKKNCSPDNKVGEFWDLYDRALVLLKDRSDSIPSAEANCRVNHPTTC